MSPARPSLIAQGRKLAKADEPDPAVLPPAPDAASAPAAKPAASARPARASGRKRATPRRDAAAEAAAAAASVPPSPEETAAATPPDAAAPEIFPVHLRRDEPLIPVGARLPWSLKEGLRLLAIREGTEIQAELAEAVAAHFAAKKFTAPSFWPGR